MLLWEPQGRPVLPPQSVCIHCSWEPQGPTRQWSLHLSLTWESQVHCTLPTPLIVTFSPKAALPFSSLITFCSIFWVRFPLHIQYILIHIPSLVHYCNSNSATKTVYHKDLVPLRADLQRVLSVI